MHKRTIQGRRSLIWGSFFTPSWIVIFLGNFDTTVTLVLLAISLSGFRRRDTPGFLWCYSCFRCKLYPFYVSFKDTFCWRLRDSSGFQCGYQTKAKFRVKLVLIHGMAMFSLNRWSWTEKKLWKNHKWAECVLHQLGSHERLKTLFTACKYLH